VLQGVTGQLAGCRDDAGLVNQAKPQFFRLGSHCLANGDESFARIDLQRFLAGRH
jgi:hypothetical protein